MNQVSLKILAAVVAGLVLLMLALDIQDNSDNTDTGQLFLSGFKPVANNLTRIRVIPPDGAETINIRKEGDLWFVEERNNYLADIGKLRQLIIALADSKVVEEKTSNPESYGQLRVGDPENSGQGIKVTVSGPDSSHSIVIGNVAQRTNRYMRIASEETSYLVDQNPDIPLTAGDWLKPSIINISSGQVRSVTIEHDDGEIIGIEKTESDQANFSVMDIPEGRELSYATVANGIAGALEDLELEDVRTKIDVTPNTTATFDTWDGLTITATITDEDESPWISITASATDSNALADDINERAAGFQYRVAAHKKNLLTRRWDDILKAANTE